MKGLVVGFGSIGQRHARILTELGIDVAVVSRRDISHTPSFKSIPAAFAAFAPDYVVIASRTHEHQDDIHTLIDSGFSGRLLIEKPLYDHRHDCPSSLLANAKIAYNLRFHPALLRYREILGKCSVYAVHAYAGSYLPNWRPGADYRLSYSAHGTMGGGVLLDLSHEIDYLLWIFGPWLRLSAIGGHFSQLEIESDDAFGLLFATKQVPLISLQLNYLDTTPTRTVVALTDQGAIRLDLMSGHVESAAGTESFLIGIDDTYRDQHYAMLTDDTSIICSLGEGLEVLGMIDASIASTQSAQWVVR